MLVVRLTVARVLEHHERRARLHLRLDDCVPHLLRAHHARRLPFGLVSTFTCRESESVYSYLYNVNMHSCKLTSTKYKYKCKRLSQLLFIEALELLAPRGVEAGAVVRVQQRPVLVRLHSLHKQVRNPKSKEQVARAVLLFARVLLRVEEIEYVGVPRLQIDGERSRTL